MAPDTTPHFYALSQGKQTEPCSAGTWLVLPPLLWIIWRAVSTRGMELALTGVDFTSFRTPPCGWNSTSANAWTMFEQPIKMCCIAQKGLHHVFIFFFYIICIIKIISAMTARMTWHPCEYVMLMWCFLPPTWVFFFFFDLSKSRVRVSVCETPIFSFGFFFFF